MSNSMIKRFCLYRIIEHMILILLFVLLIATGLPQKYHQFGLSQNMIGWFGGIVNMRFIHHMTGIAFSFLFIQHITANFIAISLGRWAASMIITLKDVYDAKQDIKCYIGLSNQSPTFGRYSYKEKFTYWLLLLGSLQMIVTGYVIWFPVEATHYLPGQFIPAAKIVHSNEAMFIFIIIVIWHIYDSIFSPEHFPINKSIFTGLGQKRSEDG